MSGSSAQSMRAVCLSKFPKFLFLPLLPGRRFRGSGCLARSGQNSKPYPMVKELQKWKIEELKNWNLLKNRTVSHVPTSFSFSVWVCRDLRPKFGCHLGFGQFHDMSTLFSCNYMFFFHSYHYILPLFVCYCKVYLFILSHYMKAIAPQQS
jgi:hypothetical protein